MLWLLPQQRNSSWPVALMLMEQMKGDAGGAGGFERWPPQQYVEYFDGTAKLCAQRFDCRGSDVDLYAVIRLQQVRSDRDASYTHIHQNLRESLDHILVSQEFYDYSRKRIWAFKGMGVTNDHLNQDNHKEDGTSDHGIVRAVFEYRPV